MCAMKTTALLSPVLLLIGCTGGGVLSISKDGDTGADADTDTDIDIDPDLEPAGDYSRSGDWTPGLTWHEVTGTGGHTLYIASWFPSADGGGEHAWYGWTGWWTEGESYSDVEPSCDEPRPVMVHSHGNSSLSWEMFWLPEFLSTHGWLVVAPDHTGNTAYDNTTGFWDLVSRRPQDIRDTYDWLLSQNADSGSPLYGCVDPDAGYLVTGYSFGGYTAYANGGALINGLGGEATGDISDPRVNGIITYAPWNASRVLTSGTSAVSVPVMTLGGQRDATVGTQYLDLHGHIENKPRILGDFENAGHYSFTPIYCATSGDGCGSNFFDQDEFTDLVQTAVLSWAEYTRGRAGAQQQIPGDIPGELSWTLVE